MTRRLKNPRTLEDIQDLTSNQLIQIATLLTTQNLAALQAVAKDPSASVLKVWFASVAAKAIAKGDMQALNALLDRIVGKVTTPLEVTATKLPDEPEKSTEERLARIRELEGLEKLLGED